MNQGRFIGRAEAIIATGMPGLYRVLAFMGVQNIYSLSDLGRAGTAFSIAQILAFFTAIGWASLILVRVPAAQSRDERIRCFYELFRMATVSLLLLGSGVMLWARFFQPDVSGLEIAAIMIGWTFYQLARHFFLALREYRRVIGYDMLLLAATAIYVPGCRYLGMAAGLSLGAALATIGALMLMNIGRPATFPLVGTFEPKGLEFGFTNFLSGGVALSLVPIAHFTDGARFAGMISLVASFSSISALIPRAISMYRMPALSKLAKAGTSLAQLTAQTRHEIAMACGGAFLVNSLIVVGIVFYERVQEHFGYELICGLAICAQGCISMLGMAYSSVLMIREESRESVLINLVSCGLFITGLTVFYITSGGTSFVFALTVCIVVTVFRNAMLKRRSRRFLVLATPPNL
ncbi:MAG TPA: hypothetical protein VHV83_04510 [Armatimonadota bacterium]|nr:hypothetical protein [Armatimonadota bacterium]